MNTIIYNASLLVGTAAVGAGAAMQWGPGIALLITGVLIVVLTLASTILFNKGAA
jgi:hypothetical protein